MRKATNIEFRTQKTWMQKNEFGDGDQDNIFGDEENI